MVNRALFSFLAFAALFLSINSCKEDEDPIVPFDFDAATITVEEGTFTEIKAKVGTPPKTDQTIKVKVTGTALYGADKDYVLDPAPDAGGNITIIIAANTSTVSIAKLTTNKDNIIEDTEKVTFTFSTPSSNVIAGSLIATEVSITDGTTIPFTFEVTTAMLNEGAPQKELRGKLEGSFPTDQVIKFKVLGDATYGADKDYSLTTIPDAEKNISVTIPANNTSFLITKLTPNADALNEESEHVLFSVASLPAKMTAASNLNLDVTIKNVPSTLGVGLVAEYLFTGNANDTSGKSNHGAVTGAVLTTGKSGVANTGYYFNGSSRITVPHNEDVNFHTADEFAISVWVAADATQNDLSGTINDIIRAWTGDGQGYPFGVSYYNSTFTSPKTFTGARYDGSFCAHIPQALTGTVNSEYHHIVFMKSGTKLEIYMDGTLRGESTDITSCDTHNTSDLYIGCRGSGIRCFTGKIDDIRIYNRKLTTDEISMLLTY